MTSVFSVSIAECDSSGREVQTQLILHAANMKNIEMPASLPMHFRSRDIADPRNDHCPTSVGIASPRGLFTKFLLLILTLANVERMMHSCAVTI